MKTKIFKILTLILFPILLIIALISPSNVDALECFFQPVSTPLNDLGSNEYVRMDGTHTGYIGGLYLYGSNQRPMEHELYGIALANNAQPLDSDGNPNVNGKIGMVSIGMSNNRQEFDTFRRLFDETRDPLYSYVNPKLKVVSGALGGGVLERWSDPTNQYYNYYWDNLTSELTRAGITQAQIQFVWIKTTEYDYKYTFPEDINQYTERMKNLVRIVKEKFPNIKITFISSRTRAHWYTLGSLNPEPYSFETGLAVRQVINDQINGDLTLNFDPTKGSVVAPYLSWGPYLWIDGLNPRSDGKTWPVYYVSPYDCVHPEAVAKDAVASMLWDFFTTDVLAKPWFSANTIPTTSPTPTVTPISTPTPTPTVEITPTPTDIITPTPTESITPTPIPTDTPTPTPTPTPITGLISSFVFNGSETASWDDLNSCTNCSNGGVAQWDTNGWFTFTNNQSSYLNLGTFPYLEGKGQYTFSIWLKPAFDRNLNAFSYVFQDGSHIRLFYLGQSNPLQSRWRFSMLNSTNNTFNVDTPLGMNWDINSWHMFTASYDGAWIRLYWDGTQISSAGAYGLVKTESAAIYLGKSITNTYFYNGSLDELKVYNYALSGSEVTTLFNTTLH